MEHDSSEVAERGSYWTRVWTHNPPRMHLDRSRTWADPTLHAFKEMMAMTDDNDGRREEKTEL